jgi:hypothetical protein
MSREPEESDNGERALWTAPQMRVLTLRDIDTLADIEVAFTFQFCCPSGDL